MYHPELNNFRWFLQEKDWELGDFICVTPTLKLLNRIWGEPINVFFDTPYVADLFQDCMWMRRLTKKPENQPFGDNKFQRSLLRTDADSEDVAHFKVTFFGSSYNMPHTYVDSCEQEPIPTSVFAAKMPVAVMLGCLHPRFTEAKRIPVDVVVKALQTIILMGGTPVLLGNANDELNYWCSVPLEDFNVINLLGKTSIREAVHVIGACKAFVSNDTGLYHAAVALKKPGVVLWGSTRFRPSPLYLPYAEPVFTHTIGLSAACSATQDQITQKLKSLS